MKSSEVLEVKCPSTQNLIILRDFQYWPKFLVPYKNVSVLQDQKDETEQNGST